MSEPGIKELLEAGLHFGHQTRRWNPRMRRYIHGERDGIHIIDLLQTEHLLAEARRFAAEVAGKGGSVLFVGTKKQARDAVKEWAERCGMPYVNQRWLGGLLTNFQTMSARIDRLHELTSLKEDGQLDLLPTKERMSMEAELEKLEYNLGGVRDMKRLPQAAVIIDLKTEAIAVREAERLRIPIIGLVDSNVDPIRVELSDPRQRRLDPVVRARGPHDRRGGRRVRRTAYRQAEAKRHAGGGGAPRREDEERQRREDEERARKEAEAAGGGQGGRGAAAAARAAAGGAGRARGQPSAELRAVPAATHEDLRRPADVKALRDRTGAAIMDCKAALEEAAGRHRQGDRDPARQGPGVGREAKRARRPARASSTSYIHADRQGGRAGRGPVRDGLRRPQRRLPGVRARGRDPHRRRSDAAAGRLDRGDPRGGTRGRAPGVRGEGPRGGQARRRRRRRSSTASSRSGRRTSCLLEQEHVRTDRYDGKTIEQLRAELASKTGENIRIARFARFVVGEE